MAHAGTLAEDLESEVWDADGLSHNLCQSTPAVGLINHLSSAILSRYLLNSFPLGCYLFIEAVNKKSMGFKGF